MPISGESREMTSRRLKARYLFIVKGYSQKEAANIVGVSENTLLKWAKKYKWKDERTKAVRKAGGLAIYIDLFFEYVRSAAPATLKDIKDAWFGFLKSHEKEIET